MTVMESQKKITHPPYWQGRTHPGPHPELTGNVETVEKRFNKRLAGQRAKRKRIARSGKHLLHGQQPMPHTCSKVSHILRDPPSSTC
jgi:hypothetical protein